MEQNKDQIIESALMRIKVTDGTNEIGNYMSEAMEEYAQGWKSKYDELKAENAALTKQLLDLKFECDQISQKRDNLKAENERLKEELNIAITANENLLARHSTWQDILYKEQQEHAALKEKYEQVMKLLEDQVKGNIHRLYQGAISEQDLHAEWEKYKTSSLQDWQNKEGV